MLYGLLGNQNLDLSTKIMYVRKIFHLLALFGKVYVMNPPMFISLIIVNLILQLNFFHPEKYLWQIFYFENLYFEFNTRTELVDAGKRWLVALGRHVSLGGAALSRYTFFCSLHGV